MTDPEYTPDDVAKWMLEQLTTHRVLEQYAAVAEIEERFGSQFVYENDNGNPAIDKKVLTRFKAIRPDDVEWDRFEKAWR